MSAEVEDVENISANQTFEWVKEDEIQLGSDAREPYFVIVNDTLHFNFFQAGNDPIAFQPNKMLRKLYLGETGKWFDKEEWGQPGEIAWQYNVENGTAYAGSYVGNHYDFFALGNVSLMLNTSRDGLNWEPSQSNHPVSYVGGGSEVGWNFDLQGNFYGVIRNEDGDKSGWGSRIAYAPHDGLG